MGQLGSHIRLINYGRTHLGQVRQNNEDNFHLWSKDDLLLAVIADGMGGAAAGEEASRIAVETIQQHLSMEQFATADTKSLTPDTTITERLRNAIQTANSNIVEKSNSSPDFRGMGTTLTLAYVRGTYAIFAHVGDSRAYLVSAKTHDIQQITADHSFVEALRMAGHITDEQALNHPLQHVLYRALGQNDELDIDMYYKRLHVGDRLVLCSDGLTRHLTAPELAQIVLAASDPAVSTQALIDLANERGGEDNLSVIVVVVEGEETIYDTQPIEHLRPEIMRATQQRNHLAPMASEESQSNFIDENVSTAEHDSQDTQDPDINPRPPNNSINAEGRDNRIPDQ